MEMTPSRRTSNVTYAGLPLMSLQTVQYKEAAITDCDFETTSSCLNPVLVDANIQHS